MRQNWTKDEMDKLAEMAAQGKTNEAIARELGRTKSAVAHKRARLFSSIEERQGNVSGLFEGTVGANAVYEAVPVENVIYCDDPHRPEVITAEDDLMKEVSDVIDRLNTLSDALAGTSEFMEGGQERLEEKCAACPLERLADMLWRG